MHITLILLIAQCFLSSAEDFTSTGSTTSKEIDQSSISSAGDFTATTGSSSKSSSSPDSMPNDLQRMVSNHMKLGRVLNALYVQMQLSENQIKGEDVLAAVWNLQGRQIIDNLVGFDYERLNQQMLQVDGELKLQNFSLMTDLFDSKDLGFARKTLETVAGKDVKKMLEKLVSDSVKSYFGPDSMFKFNFARWYLKENLAKKTLRAIGNGIRFYHTFELVTYRLESCCYLLDMDSLRPRLKTQFDFYRQDDVNILTETFQFSRDLMSNHTNLQSLSSFLNETYLKIEQLKLNVSFIDSNNDINYGGKVLREVFNPSSGMYSALASLSEANFLIIYDDLKDAWLQNMLKYAKSKEELEVVLNKLKIYLEELSNVNEHLKSIVSDTSRLDDAFDFTFVADRWNRFISSIHGAGICTGAVLEKAQPDYVANLQKMEEFHLYNSWYQYAIYIIHTAFYEWSDREEVLRVLRSAVEIMETASRSNFKTKLSSIDVALLNTTLQNATDHFEKFVMNPTNIDNGVRLAPAWNIFAQTHEWLSQQVILKDECQQLLKPPFLSPQQIDELRMTLIQIRTVIDQKILPELASQFQKIAVLKSSLEKLNSIEVSPPSIPVMDKTERRFSSDIRDSLLGVIEAISIFGKMHEIFVNEPAFLAIINHGDYVKKLVNQTADGQAMYESSKDIWSTHWDTFKENLTAFWRINSNAIQNITTSSESSLKEISEKYRMIGESTSFVGLQQLDKLTILWNSMKHLNSTNNTTVQMVSDAFRQIQYPIMTVDWQSVGLKFQECPIKFDQVDGALEAFLGAGNEKSTAPPQFSTKYFNPTTEEKKLKTKKPTTPTQFFTEYVNPAEEEVAQKLEPSESPLEKFQMRGIGSFLTVGVCVLTIFVIRRSG